MTKTLGEFLEEGLANVKAMDDFLSCMTDFERSVWEDIIDFAEEAFGLNEDDLIRELRTHYSQILGIEVRLRNNGSLAQLDRATAF